MTQSLVIDHANVNIGLHLLAPNTRVERLASVVVKTGGLQLLAEVVHCALLLTELERSTVLCITPASESYHVLAVKGARLTRHGLDKHTDGHT